METVLSMSNTHNGNCPITGQDTHTMVAVSKVTTADLLSNPHTMVAVSKVPVFISKEAQEVKLINTMLLTKRNQTVHALNL